MKNTSEKFLTFALFVLGTYGERLFILFRTLLVSIPPALLGNALLIIVVCILIFKSK